MKGGQHGKGRMGGMGMENMALKRRPKEDGKPSDSSDSSELSRWRNSTTGVMQGT